MPRERITRETLERQFDNQPDPISTLHPDFPTVHSRIPKTVSKFITATLHEIDAGTAAVPSGKIDPAKRDALRANLRTYMRRR